MNGALCRLLQQIKLLFECNFAGADRSEPDVRLPALGADAEGSRRLGGNDTLT